jgi:hypothetical protein
MFLFDALIAIARFLISWFWLPFVDQSRESDGAAPVTRDGAQDGGARDRVTHDARVDTDQVLPKQHADDLEKQSRAMQDRDLAEHVTQPSSGSGSVEDHVTDTFLSQLEQRTQQVKITLANLEAEKTRIEAQIAQLQPIIPHYDALLEAERNIAGSHIDFGETAGSGATEASSDAPAGEGATQDAAAAAESESPMGEATSQGTGWTSYSG